MAKGSKKNAKEELEKKIEETKKFLENWKKYKELFSGSYRGKEIGREDEVAFLKLKSLLARRHAFILASLGDYYISSQQITHLLSLTVTLFNIKSVPDFHYKNIETEWHDTYIHLNETLGELRYHLDH